MQITHTYTNAEGLLVKVLAPSTKGRNSRSLSMSWPHHAKRAKRQNVGGRVPFLTTTNWGNV